MSSHKPKLLPVIGLFLLFSLSALWWLRPGSSLIRDDSQFISKLEDTSVESGVWSEAKPTTKSTPKPTSTPTTEQPSAVDSPTPFQAVGSVSVPADDRDEIPPHLRANIDLIRTMDPNECATDHLIIGFKKVLTESTTAGSADIEKLNTARSGLHHLVGTEILHEFPLISAHVVKVPKDMTLVEAATLYAHDPSVDYIEPDIRIYPNTVPNDPSYSNLWGLKRIRAEEVWNISTGSTAVKVAVCDTGIATHNDLTSNRWINPGESGIDALGRNKASNGVDDEGNGFIDDIHGWAWFEDSNWITHNDNIVTDTSGHGTHVSGTIGAAGNNALGVSGVNWNTQLVTLKFMQGGNGGYLTNLVKCIDYARLNGCRVVNISAGGAGITFTTLKNAILAAGDAGVLIVSAAGNSQTDAAQQTPANSGAPLALVVGAIGPDGKKAYYSNYSTSIVHLAAPGGNQKLINNDGIQSTFLNNGYSYLQGTSMATPHVAGAAALLWSIYPDATLTEIRDAILNGARINPALVSWFQDGRELDVMGAQEYLSPLQVTPSPATVSEGGTSQIAVSLKKAPTTDVTVMVERVSGSANLYLPVVPSLVFTPSNWATPQFVTIQSLDDADNTNDTAIFLVKGPVGIGGISLKFEQIDTLGVPVITTAVLPEAEVGKAYSTTLAATSARTLTLTVGTKPEWLTFMDHGDGTATLSGIPTETSNSNITFTASDGTWSTEKSLTLYVGPTLPGNVMIHDTFATTTGSWFKGGNTGTLNHANGQIHWQEAGTNMEEVIGRSFPEVTLAVGQKIRLSFNYRQIGAGSIMRAGLYDVTNPISADNWSGGNAIGTWKGYYSFVRDNSTSTSETRRETGSTTSASSGPTVGSSVISPTNNTEFNLNDDGTVSYQCAFEVEYVSATLMNTWFTVSSTTDGVVTTHFSITGSTNTIYNKFDSVALRYTNGSMTAAYDNVKVEILPNDDGDVIAAPVITTDSLPVALLGVPYSATVTATSEGSLIMTIETKPEWLNFTDLGNGTAILSGIPTEADSFDLILTADNGTWSTNKTLPLYVNQSLTTGGFHDTFDSGTGAWFKGGSSGTLTNDTGQLSWLEFGDNMAEVIGRSFPKISLSVGDKIRLSFDYRQNGTPAGTNIFRVGLYDVTSPVSADNWLGGNMIGSWRGFSTFIRDNSTLSNLSRIECGSTTSGTDGPFRLTNTNITVTEISPAVVSQFNINDTGNVTYQGVFEISYTTANQMDTLFTLTSTTNGVTTTHFSIPGNTAGIYNSFNTIALRYTNNPMTLFFDNVKVEVSSHATPQNPAVFSDWQQLTWPEEINPAITGLNQDPDGDGMNNLMEWALHLDPTKTSAFQPNLAQDNETLGFNYIRRKTAPGEATFVVEWSDTLGNDWSNFGVELSPAVSLDETSESVNATIPTSPNNRRFVRVRIVKP